MIIIKKALSPEIPFPQLNNELFLTIKIKSNEGSMFIMGAYLPPENENKIIN